MTRAVVNGKLYDTRTATWIADIGSAPGTSIDEFRYWEAELFVSANGNFFMCGSGNARSPFAREYGQNGWTGSEGIVALKPAEALAYAENVAGTDTLLEHFGKLIHEA
jgi:hypothetical protein